MASKFYLIILIAVFAYSCSDYKQTNFVQNDLKKTIIGDYMTPSDAKEYLENRKKILPKLKQLSINELLVSVEYLPDGGQYLPKGDFFSEEIINRGDKAIPFLINQIDNQTLSKVKKYDSINYTIGDVAINLIEYAASDDFSLANYFTDNLKEVGDFTNPYSFDAEYFRIIKNNKKNQMKLIKFLKSHYVSYNNIHK